MTAPEEPESVQKQRRQMIHGEGRAVCEREHVEEL